MSKLVLPVLCFPIFDVLEYSIIERKRRKGRKKKRSGFFLFQKAKKTRTKISLSTSEKFSLIFFFRIFNRKRRGGAAVHPVGMDPPPHPAYFDKRDDLITCICSQPRTFFFLFWCAAQRKAGTTKVRTYALLHAVSFCMRPKWGL